MRTIKFRAWDKEELSFIYAEPVYGFFPSLHMELETKGMEDRYGNIEQFTGLFDKNGKEIFEGDIIYYIGLKGYQAEYHVKCSVVWDEKQARWSIYGKIPSHGTSRALKDWNSKSEVIGNIYENPELLN
jgi:uncharacterized phage protein (TIGR01671 family)